MRQQFVLQRLGRQITPPDDFPAPKRRKSTAEKRDCSDQYLHWSQTKLYNENITLYKKFFDNKTTEFEQLEPTDSFSFIFSSSNGTLKLVGPHTDFWPGISMVSIGSSSMGWLFFHSNQEMEMLVFALQSRHLFFQALDFGKQTLK
ncbi:hypothetical protein niasHT_016419 [Heterodera trifolii]|uniref:Uncharacterized protein n=1 Tax=Heterodera trifolii TaxID=157864 RepID=A0ABD2LIY4_9BILA